MDARKRMTSSLEMFWNFRTSQSDGYGYAITLEGYGDIKSMVATEAFLAWSKPRY